MITPWGSVSAPGGTFREFFLWALSRSLAEYKSSLSEDEEDSEAEDRSVSEYGIGTTTETPMENSAADELDVPLEVITAADNTLAGKWHSTKRVRVVKKRRDKRFDKWHGSMLTSDLKKGKSAKTGRRGED